MINVVTEFGTSFKGLAAYLLHDVGQADSSERVAWTETHGLATDDPDRAWRIMAATAMSQSALKAEAGVKNTGRKSNKHVMHYVLSWSPDEHGQIDRAEMVAAAKASMSYLGTYEGEKLGKKKVAKRTQHADEHQAVIVCHDEGPGKNPHIHIMLNRVHPQHGVMLPDSKDYEKLSAWALDYRRAQGNEHYCEQRVKNAAKKAQGVVTNNPRKPRNVYEQDQAKTAADPGSRKKALLEQQEQRRKELAKKTAEQRDRHAVAVRALEVDHLTAERAERAKSAERIKAKTAAVRAAYAPKIDAMTKRHAAELAVFRDARGTAAGHVRNTWEAFKTKRWMSEIRTRPLEAMKHSFTLAFSSGLQLNDIEKHHGREQGELRGKRCGEERDASRGIRTDEGFALDDLWQKYHRDRSDLMLAQGMDQAKLKAEWRQLDMDRRMTVIDDERSNKVCVNAGLDKGAAFPPEDQSTRSAPTVKNAHLGSAQKPRGRDVPVSKPDEQAQRSMERPGPVPAQDVSDRRAQQIEKARQMMKARQTGRIQQRDQQDRDR